MPRRGRRRGGGGGGGGGPAEDDNRTSPPVEDRNDNGRDGKDEGDLNSEEGDAESSFEAKLTTSLRRKSRRLSFGGNSFKSKLALVDEDAEADHIMNDESIERLSGDANGGYKNRVASELSESINIMDFGVDNWRRGSLHSSEMSEYMSESTLDVSLTSSCVDSEGFLPWRREESSQSLSSEPCSCLRRGSNTELSLNESEPSNHNSDPSRLNLVESNEFLGREEGERDCGVGDPRADAVAGSTTVNDVGKKKGSSERYSGETWRIEDYEGTNDDAKRRISFPKILSALRFPTAKSQRPIFVAAPRDDSIKDLLKGRRSTGNAVMLSSSTNKVREIANDGGDNSASRKSTSAPLFGKFRWGSDVSTSHELNEHRSIHVGADSVDIGELRRNLNKASTARRNST
jgi:hypothetical protein